MWHILTIRLDLSLAASQIAACNMPEELMACSGLHNRQQQSVMCCMPGCHSNNLKIMLLSMQGLECRLSKSRNNTCKSTLDYNRQRRIEMLPSCLSEIHVAEQQGNIHDCLLPMSLED